MSLWLLQILLQIHPAVLAAEVQNFAFFGRDRERVREILDLENSRIVGAQLGYAWRELEPEEGRYDFSLIEADLALLERHGKKLWIQLYDVTFDPSRYAVPDYIYDGGMTIYHYYRAERDGIIAKRWDPEVQRHFHRLLAKLGERFDGRIAGLNLAETALDVECPDTFDHLRYYRAIRSNMRALRSSFAESVPMQYANFMPGEWLPDDDKGYLQGIYDLGKEIGVALGVPDLMPNREAHRHHGYAMMRKLTGSHPVSVAVQDGNYRSATGTEQEGEAIGVSELAEFAEEDLQVSFIFWGAQEPYFTRDVLPFLAF